MNFTTLSAPTVLKFVPEMVTIAPTAPLVGVKPVIVGVGSTVKLDPVVTVTPLTVTEMGPEVAPAGTVTVRLVVVATVTTAWVPLNLTTLFTAVVLKFVPEITTVAPMAPLVGLKLVIVGDPGTVKVALLTVTPLTVTAIGPVDAPTGTVVVIEVEVKPVTTAVTPLNVTTGVEMKLVPVIVTEAPEAPMVGLIPVIVGEG